MLSQSCEFTDRVDGRTSFSSKQGLLFELSGDWIRPAVRTEIKHKLPFLNKPSFLISPKHCFVLMYLHLPLLWCTCMAIIVSIQYNGGFLPDITPLTLCYYRGGTRFNAMKSCFHYGKAYLCPQLNVLTNIVYEQLGLDRFQTIKGNSRQTNKQKMD